jgi:hypothetical protein
VNTVRRFKMLGLAVPALALALMLLVVAWGNASHTAFAAAGDGTAEFHLSVTGCANTTAPDVAAKCAVPTGSTFTVNAFIDGMGAGATGYSAFAVTLNYAGGLLSKDNPSTASWPSCVFAASAGQGSGTFINGGCAKGVGTANSTYIGKVFTNDFNCPQTPGQGTITMFHDTAGTKIVADNGTHTDNGPDVLTINCVAATNTPTQTPTATPPPQPRVFKSCTSLNNATPSALCNVFLTRQGAKIPPSRCQAGNNVATLSEGINIPITSSDPKGLTGFQQLAAFEFEVRFDAKTACVSIAPGPAWANAVCSTLDNGDKGVIRYGCVTIGKNNGMNATVPAGALAIIKVRPEVELYSQLRPNQDNGIPVQILNQGCKLSDEQGHVIPIFSCEDADLTFRYLEGDIDGPDCDVDVLDAQQVAFRWGASTGSLLYNSFMDLSPSGQVKGDGHINITDLQFVFGRLGSTCTAPWPAQPPVNPKA